MAPAVSADPAYPPIDSYALIGDCHSAALVSRSGSIDWCCLPRFDSDSCFGRLLDWNRGGYFAITPVGSYKVRREYRGDSLILVTTFTTRTGEARLVDFFSMRSGGRLRPRRELVRVIHGLKGQVTFDVTVVPRLDFGEVKPWIYESGECALSAVGSSTGLRVFGDVPLQLAGDHDLHARVEVTRGARYHIGLTVFQPEDMPKQERSARKDLAELKAHYLETRQWWKDWSAKIRYRDGRGATILRSAITLKALSYAPTGAIVAAVTTSLPETAGGERNWDYRYCWVRDSVFTVRALSTLGLESEADGVRRFIQRSAAGNAHELQVLYAVDGKRRIPEIVLNLEGWRGSRPVRIGNAASQQFQLDMYGIIVELSWRWSERGVRPSQDYWDFLVSVVEVAIEKSTQPDRGIWEIRSQPRHFVNSKVMCWAAIDGGLALAEKYSLAAPLDRWRKQRDDLRREIETHGVDHKRGIFVQSYGSSAVDAALLLLPAVEFVPYDDERMVRTTDVIRRELSWNGLILRYKSQDGLKGQEGVFLACTFWLAECLARQGRRALALQAFKRASGAANELGLFAEQYAPHTREMLGNFPQGLTHLAHISAALALEAPHTTAGSKQVQSLLDRGHGSRAQHAIQARSQLPPRRTGPASRATRRR